ncbi:hypothetical protein FDA77_00930 [Clostridium botulinum]|nr:hypothetical protein [Clostridium botulinum]NFJ88513.1 hypothetical protein [Clostridium botulinum]HDI3121672.1 hypothetical protein [Clostridium botulinum]
MENKLKRRKNRHTYKYDGHSNPWEWRKRKYLFELSFEEKIELWKKESKERNKTLKMKEHTISETKAKKQENSKRNKSN